MYLHLKLKKGDAAHFYLGQAHITAKSTSGQDYSVFWMQRTEATLDFVRKPKSAT